MTSQSHHLPILCCMEEVEGVKEGGGLKTSKTGWCLHAEQCLWQWLVVVNLLKDNVTIFKLQIIILSVIELLDSVNHIQLVQLAQSSTGA